MDWAGLILAQPQGWTQPSRVGWADIPTSIKQGCTQLKPKLTPKLIFLTIKPSINSIKLSI